MGLVEYYTECRREFRARGYKWPTSKGLRHYLYRVNGTIDNLREDNYKKRVVRLNA